MIKISYSNLKDKFAKCKDSIRELGRRSGPIHDSLEECEQSVPYGRARTYGQALEEAGKIVLQQLKEAEIDKERKSKPKVDTSKSSSYAKRFVRNTYSPEEHLMAGKMESFNGIPKENLIKSSKQENPFSLKPKEPEKY